MHYYTKNAQDEWIHGQPQQTLTTGDKALMAVGVLLVIVGAVMGVL
jgi:hypothetical protein